MIQNFDVNQFSSLVNFIKHLPGCIYYKDIQGRYLACSDHMVHESNLGSPETILGKNDYDIFPRAQAESLRKNDIKVIQTRQPFIAEETITLPNGMEKTYQAIKTPYLDNKGNIIGILGNSVDITHLKMTEKSLKYAKAFDSIQPANQHKILMPLKIKRSLAMEINDKHFLKSVEINNFRLWLNPQQQITLTKREFDCLQYLAFGHTFKGMAKKMGISTRTVETHIRKVKIKTNQLAKEALIEMFFQNINLRS